MDGDPAVQTKAGLAALRPLKAADIDAIVRFWYGSGDELLDFLGIDRSRLGTVEDTRRRFLRAVPTGDTDQENIAFAITVNEQIAVYTLLNRYTPEVNYSHWHITDPSLRASGLSTALYPRRISTYFDSVPINRLTHQTRTRNVAVNRMLDRYVPGAACFGKDIPGFFETAGSYCITQS
jgi:hypothetical protein